MQPINEQQDTLGQNQQKLIVVWGALMMSQLFLLSMLFFVKNDLFQVDLDKPLAGDNPTMILVAAMLSTTTFIISFVLKSQMLKQAIAEQSVAILQSALIIALALCESISLMGVLLAFALHYQYFFLWFALGIFGILLHFPKRKDLIAVSFKNQ
jgi:F0F1-type ATP synthase membrane subunit c/vacuolar-type H+-ATPase subunit K